MILIQGIRKEEKKEEEVMGCKGEMILGIKKIHKDQKKEKIKLLGQGKGMDIKVIIKLEVAIIIIDIIITIMIDHYQDINIEIIMIIEIVVIHVNVVEIGSQENGEVGLINSNHQEEGVIIMIVVIIVIIKEEMIGNRIVKEESIKVGIIIIIRKGWKKVISMRKVMLGIIEVILRCLYVEEYIVFSKY